MNGLMRETRLQIMLNDDELQAVDDWRFRHRMPSRAAAIRQLLKAGLQSVVTEVDGANTMKSQDYGLLDSTDINEDS
jgi:metal-responsive CopG/Arc/MetJ family transcriptional regulator